ncbi:MAG: DUF4280 domain-containing protein [Flavobacterium sp.]|nr:MAG: DUF4280 domain-containing protein [Flavobacterium sp.]
MAKKYYVVQGATCQCKFSVEPQTDILQVKTQSKHFGNDNETKDKLIATTKDIGQTMKKNTFGKCKMQPTGHDFMPCQINITKWSSFYEKTTYSNGGKALLEDSKASCPKGAPDCITIINHGQTAALTKKNIENSKPEVLAEILPGIDFKDLGEEVFIINNN